MDKKQLRNTLMLMACAFIWGTAFVAQSVGMDHIGPFTFNAVRSLVGGIALLPVILIFQRRKTPERRQQEKERKKYKFLSAHCENLTLKAKDGKIDRIVGSRWASSTPRWGRPALSLPCTL